MGVSLNDRFPLGVEAAALLISELTLEPSYTRSGNGTHSTFANLARNGLRLAIKLRNAPVTVSPHHDQFNNFTMDVKLPNDFQGNNLKHLEEVISSGGTGWPAVELLLGRFNGDFTFKSRLYGTSSLFRVSSVDRTLTASDCRDWREHVPVTQTAGEREGCSEEC